MKEDYLVIAAIFAGALFLMRKANATPNATVGAPTIGTNGTILTADKQYLYDGKVWSILGANGYTVIPGQ